MDPERNKPLVAAVLVPIARPRLSFSRADASAFSNVSGLEVTYLGNEGVLIAAGEQHVLIDALHGPYSEYVSPPRHELRAMQEGKFPYNGGEVVLVTHVHGESAEKPFRTAEVASAAVASAMLPFPKTQGTDSPKAVS